MIEIYIIPIPQTEGIHTSVNHFFESLYAGSAEVCEFRVQDKQKLPSSLGYAALHYLVRKKTGVNRALRLGYNPQGKPFLFDFPDIFFNISHSGIYTCIGLANNEIGIDVERNRICKLGIVNRFFHPQEAEDIALLPEGNIRNQYFTKLWSLKESYVKQSGRGIAHIFNNFALRLQDEDIIFANRLETGKVFFRTYDCLENYCLSVCAAEENFPEKPEILSAETIVEER